MIRIVGDPALRKYDEAGTTKEKYLYYVAAMTLSTYGTNAREAVPVLIGSLLDGVTILTSGGTFNCVREPITSIERLKPEAKPLLDAVFQPDSNPNWFEYLIDELQSKEPWRQERAAYGLSSHRAKYGMHRKPSFEALIKLKEGLQLALKSDNPRLRFNAACALALRSN